MNEREKMKEWALKYAHMGLAVFPLEYRGKTPVISGGVKNATTDEAQIEEWWTDKPFANIGLACGAVSGGLLVVDIDIDDDKGVHGDDSLRDWEHEHGEIPETVFTITGRGGNHYLYRCGDNSIKNRAGVLPGIDIRCNGGYIVAPPSIHKNGNEYEFDILHDIDDMEIAEADSNILALARLGQTAKVDDNGVAEPHDRMKLPEIIPNGKRNDLLYKKACSMQSDGASDEDIYDLLHYYAQYRCETPLDANDMKELDRSIEGVLTRYKKGNSKEIAQKFKPNVYKPLSTVSGSELQNMETKPADFIVDGILPAGISILASPPKSGKSWMVLDLALCVACGRDFLGHHTQKSEVLYLALEDSLDRVKSRIAKLEGNRNIPDGLHIGIESMRVDHTNEQNGLVAQLKEFSGEHPNCKLVIIDTLQIVKPPKGKNTDGYADSYGFMNDLRPLYTNLGIAVLLVHHTRKQSKEDVDPFETFLGSQALTGGSDGMYLIRRNKKDEFAKFLGRGRDFEDIELCIKMDDNCRWQNYGDSQEMADWARYNEDPSVMTLRTIMEDREEMQLTAKDWETCCKGIAGFKGMSLSKLVQNHSFDLQAEGYHIEIPNGPTYVDGKSGRWFTITNLKKKAENTKTLK